MKVELLETVHETFLPKGTIGETFMDSEGFRRFKPDNPVSDYGFTPSGAYIGNAKYRELTTAST